MVEADEFAGLSGDRECRIVRFYYDGGTRDVEPHSHGFSKEGNELVKRISSSWLQSVRTSLDRQRRSLRCPRAGYKLQVVKLLQGINPRDLRLGLEENPAKLGAAVLSEIPFDFSEAAAVGQLDTVTLVPGGTKKVRIVS